MAYVYLNYLAQGPVLPVDGFVNTLLSFCSDSAEHDELMTAEEQEFIKINN